MLFALAFAGCSNLAVPDWGGDGSRYASGYAGGAAGADSADTAGGGDEGAPVIVGSTAEMAANEAGELYALIGLTYEDDAGDVVGGNVYYSALVADIEQESGSRRITSQPTYDSSTQAYDQDGVLQFSVGPLEDVGTYSFRVYIVDLNHNTSEATTVDVVSE